MRPVPRRPHRLGLALVSLHVSAGLYFAFGLSSLWLFPWLIESDGLERSIGVGLGVGMLLFCLALIVGIELVAHGLRRRRFWAWVVGVCIFGIYAASLFFPLGVLGLWGLLDASSLRAFGVGSARSGRAQRRGQASGSRSAVPELPVSDLAQSTGFYRDRLGFTLVHRGLGLALLHRDGAELHLLGVTDGRWRERGRWQPVASGFPAGSCRIEVASVDALHAELGPLGIPDPRTPADASPWGSRELAVLDPDRNLVTFFESR